MKAIWMAALCLAGCGGAAAVEQRPPAPVSAATPEPGRLTMEGAPARRFVEAEKPTTLDVRLRVAAVTDVKTPRPPVNLALVLDTSGSMEGDAIRDVRDAATRMLDALQAGDRISIVTFGSTSDVLVPSTVVSDASRADIRTRIGRIEARGTTDMADGLAAGLQQVLAGRQQGGVDRIVLVGDGIPNDPTPLLPLAQSAQAQGVTITALGLGPEYDETLLGAVAQASGGRFHYLQQSEQVAAVFRDEVVRMQRVVARGATLVLQPGPGVTVQGAIGLSLQPTGNRGAYVSLGDLSEGDEREVIVQVQVAGHRDGLAVELMDAVLSWQSPANSGVRHDQRVYLSTHASADAKKLADGHDEDVERAAARARAAAATVQAIATARAGDVRAAQSQLDAAEIAAREQAKRLGDKSLQRHVDNMRRLRPTLQAVAPSASPPPVESAQTVRAVHDEAMSTLQGE